MPTRRPHAKSRKGCLKCKSRHVRCDESGPPCGRCNIRGDVCEYADPQLTTKDTTSILTSTSPGSTSTTSALPLSREVLFPNDGHLLQLQLMHRWTVATYKCCCTPGSEDDEVWQSWVPQLAIKHDYLLYGLLSLTSFEIARLTKTPHHKRYVESATEYHSLALSSFRVQLSVIGSEDIDAAVCMSLMLLVLSFASAQGRARSSADDESDGIIQTVLAHFELLRGCAPIIESKRDYMSRNPYIQKLKPFEDLARTPLDPRVEEALVKLTELNDKRVTSSIHDTVQRRSQQVEYWEVCKTAVGILRTLYEKCVDDFTRGYALGWLNMAGDRYVTAVKNGDAVALLMLMYWGVMVEKCGSQVWWAEHFGSLLVAEIAHLKLFRNADLATKDLISQAKDLIESS
ncbi:Zn2/Cys6 DNA-binding protein [Glarea lozoyensis ATCC 20868]|uniref:Zn2/Cys6 DNA-binding protein n=1 Tax=Glarea lozoyensis (strain ATCC 20868 / MF5171) TaxID=1116229 RepID=S3DE99_GLAL2|nr:Zn2/Cys6 DNA-binding protein [Glarea lozoyensis ATCC 20868]EPE24988.1 Zn2/Cys6 DNA-binding protein [Glarea lozoyensis ATCC 20868]